MHHAVDYGPTDACWVFWRVFDQVLWVVIDPIGRHDFAVDDDAVSDVGFNDGNGSFAHTTYSIQTYPLPPAAPLVPAVPPAPTVTVIPVPAVTAAPCTM